MSEQYRLNQYDRRTRFSLNEIIVYEDYAEIILYDKSQREKARALIDLDDVDRCRNIKWCYDRYVRNTTTKLMLHRYVMGYDNDLVIDHINGNPLDNRKSNLRICDTSQNAMNQKTSTRNNSGAKGVFWDKHRNKWRVTIAIGKHPKTVGRFNTYEEAVYAREQAEIEYYGNFRRRD